MSVHELRDRIALLLDTDLDVEERRELERWVAHDPELRRRLRGFRDVWSLLDAFPALRASPSLAAGLVARARAEAAAERRARILRLAVGWAAAAALFLAVFLGLPHEPAGTGRAAVQAGVELNEDYTLYVASLYDFEDF